MNFKYYLLSSLFCFISIGLNAQHRYARPLHPELPFTSVIIDSTTPDWAIKLYSENPNMKEVASLFLKWKTENKDVKNAHTRNYKHYAAYLISNDRLDEFGFVKPTNDTEARNKAWLKKRKTLLAEERSRSTNSWSVIGPIFVPETQGRVNAQSNIYSIDQSKSNPDILYCGTETDYVFKSTDRGDTWQCVTEDVFFGGPMEIEIHPYDPDIVYLSTSHDIMKTTDGGANWTSVRYNWNQNISSIIIHPNDPEIVLAGGNEGLFKTINGGDTWTEITSLRIYDLKFKSDDPSIVFALRNNTTDLVTEFYRSTDTGDSWTQITDGWDEPDPSSSNKGGRMTISDMYSDVIYTFTGASYTTLNDPKNGIKIRKSSDAGLSWQLLVDSDQVFYNSNGNSTKINNGQGYYDWDIEMMDADTNVVMLGTQGKWLTDNGFSNDTLAGWGASVGGHSDMQEVLFNGSDYWVATDGGIVKCDEGLMSYDIKMDGINCAEFWSFDQGWNRDAQVGTLYHNGTIGSTDTYAPGIFRFFGGAEPSFSQLKHPNPDKIISKGYGSVNGKTMPDEFSDPEESFSYNLTPNSNYAIWLTNEESEIEISPYNYNIHWAGESNKLMKSYNFGTTWETAYTGRDGGKITKIEIPKSNPDIMYVGEHHSTGYAIYKSTDEGITFSSLANLPNIAGSDDDGVFLSCDHTDEDVLFIAFRENDNDNDKVWMTTDGGSSWTNINTTSNILDGESITDILAISGTNGDLYVTTDHGVYHRSNNDEWSSCIDGLPVNLRIRHIKPFYKEGQIRIGTMNRGVFSMDMINQPTEIEVQPTVSVTDAHCSKDTFYFDDYSILNHTNASWSWTFDPAPAYVDDLNIRNPKVVFPSNGTYHAALSITQNGNTYTDSLDQPIVLESQCEPDDFPGGSYKMVDYQDHGEATDEGRVLSEWTVSFWIKPDLNTNETATMFDALESNNTRDFCANFYQSTQNPTMHYTGAGGSAWGVNPGMSVTLDEWNHIAYTSSVASGDVTIYVNGESFVYPNVNAAPISFEKMVVGWQYGWWGGRYYEGEMDELAIYERALTQDEIRLRMHITKDLSDDADLIHYYQWNEDPSGIAYDKINTSHLVLATEKVTSTGPFADGTSSKLDITSGGVKSFPSEGVEMEFASSGIYPDGEVVVTRLNHLPDFSPSKDQGSEKYWVIHNFGNNESFDKLNDISFEGFGVLSDSESDAPSEFELFQRNFGQFSNTWNVSIDAAATIDANPSNTIFYNSAGITSFGQYYITKGDCSSNQVVSASVDSGINSLRIALKNACPSDTIYFDIATDNNPIFLSSSSLDITKDVYLIGNGGSKTILDGNSSRRIFNILNPNTNFGFENIALKNALEGIDGGAILNYGTTTIKESLFELNFEGITPKALTNYGTLNILPGLTEIKE